jgi:hypothetical protein
MSLTADMAFLDTIKNIVTRNCPETRKHNTTGNRNAMSKHGAPINLSFGDIAFLDAALNPVTGKRSIAVGHFDAGNRNAMSYTKEINQA